MFNPNALQERILFCLKNKFDIQKFIQQEYNFIEQTILKVQERQKEEKRKNTIKMLSAVQKKLQDIKKYPKAHLSIDVPDIMAYFIGAISSFYKLYYPEILPQLYNSKKWISVQYIFSCLKQFYIPEHIKETKYIKEIIEKIKQKEDKKERQILENNFIHSGLTTLHLLKKYTNDILENLETNSISEYYNLSRSLNKMLYDINKITKHFSFQF